MPKLLQINSAKNCGSTGKIAEQISLVTQSHGWETYIAHGYRYDRGGEIPGYNVTGKYGEYAHLVKSYLADGQGLGSVAETKRLVKWIESINPDVVHLHNIHGYYVNYKILFKFLASRTIPVVWTLHDCWPFTGHCVYFDRIGCDKWKVGCFDCPQKKAYPKSLVDRSSKNYQRKKNCFTSIDNLTIVPVSDWLGGLVKDSFWGNYPIHTIHNGIDLDKFKPCESDFREKHGLEDKFIVLGVADGYGKRKGIPDFNKLSERFGNDVKIVMVGLSESDKKRVGPNILGMGRTSSQQELIDIYSTADVFINPTYEDNFPTTNLEALACGTPVITYATGGSPEAIDEHTGIVVNKGDVEEMYKAIELVRKIGKTSYSSVCRERALNCFNKDDRFEDYFRLYEEILSK